MIIHLPIPDLKYIRSKTFFCLFQSSYFGSYCLCQICSKLKNAVIWYIMDQTHILFIQLNEDLKELESILKSVVRSNVRKTIADEISSLKNQIDTLEKDKQKESSTEKIPENKPAIQLYTKKITSYGELHFLFPIQNIF